MATGDGLLARVALARPALAPPAAAALAAAAAAFGNGRIEISRRGSIQVRGLSAGTAPRFAERIEALGIVAPAIPAISVNPLAEDDAALTADPLAVARAVRDLVAADLAGMTLAPKIAVVVDGGGVLPLDALDGDIRLTAIDGAWQVAVAGTAATALPLAIVGDADAAPAALALLRLLGTHGAAPRARTMIERDGADAFRHALRPFQAGAPRSGRAVVDARQAIGRHALGNGMIAVGLGLPAGGIDAAVLVALADAAAHLGVRGLCPAAPHALLCTGLTAASADAMAGAAAALGFIADPADPRLRIAACSGRPACAAAHLDTLALARAVVPAAGMLHISGCPKGCAHPGTATLTLVGRSDGVGIVRNGRAGDVPDQILPLLPPALLAARIATLSEAETR